MHLLKGNDASFVEQRPSSIALPAHAEPRLSAAVGTRSAGARHDPGTTNDATHPWPAGRRSQKPDGGGDPRSDQSIARMCGSAPYGRVGYGHKT